VHAAAGAPSSEQVVLVGAPAVDHARLAKVSLVDAGGPLVMATVGAVPEGGADVIVHVCVVDALP